MVKKKVSECVLLIFNYKFVNKFTFKQIVFLLSLGALLTLAYHPFDLFFIIPISLTSLLLYLDSKKGLKQKFIAGVIFGYGHFLSSLYWIMYSLLTDFSGLWWMIPFVLILIPLVIALFIGLLVIAAQYFNYHRIAYVLGFSALWVIFEFLRSFLVFPFPWNLLGYTVLSFENVSQFASVVGVYGLSFIVCTFGTCFYSRNIKYILAVFMCYLAIFSFGYMRLKDAKVEYIKDYTLRLVQPNLTEHHMGDPEKQSRDFLKLIKLSLKDLKENTITIWPEASFPYILHDGSTFKTLLAEIISKNGFLITGADWLEPDKESGKWNLYNSIVTLNKQGKVISVYKKILLVPFGEYIPLRKYFPDFIEKVAYGIGDFNSGKQFKTTRISENLPAILNLICYESIFTHVPYAYQGQDFGLMLNITNDAWFGNSIGPYQHYTMARMRAIEYNTPLIRVAKHGITGVIDQFGRVLAELEINNEGFLNTNVPKKTLQSSFYLLYYHISAIWISILTFLLICAKRRFK
ncbi:apolipoprotein N-acyltransferase [Holosporaceae bacterium 'Namur']|nr:apolipoprotein N-acyltransferase [Holosporaceae bacterium 'Namur']